MDLIDRLRQISARIPKQIEHLGTEEATKNALVMPFISALGYDVFDPLVVVPEFTADVGTKKGEKVDYAIIGDDGKPIILVECKTVGTDLDQAHASQLYRYFSVTDARFGVLTDGVSYRFFSDLDRQNKMDSRPFFEFSMLDVTPGLVKELKKFTRDTFDLDEILSTANELKHTKGIKKILAEEWVEPSDEFVRLLAARVHSGRMTQSVRDRFASITKKALSEFLNERVDERLKSALERESGEEPGEHEGAEEVDNGIVTTDEEWEGYYLVKAILRDIVDSHRVTIRDRKSYCAIMLDDTNRKPICRMYFNAAKKCVSVFDVRKAEHKHEVDGVDDIFKLSEEIRETVRRYEGTVAETSSGNSKGPSEE